MRYTMDEILRTQFEKKWKHLEKQMPKVTDMDKEMIALCKKYYEFGFDDGCESTSVYSDSMAKLYEPIEPPKLTI